MKTKNILILINQAPNYCYTYKAIGDYLKSKNHNVFYAIDSQITKILHSDCFTDEDEIACFSNYFSTNNDNPELINETHLSENLNNMYFSDFERKEVYKIHQKKPKSYFRNLKINLLNFFEQEIHKNEIDLILYENVSNSFAYSAYLCAKALNIQYAGMTSTALKGRFSIQKNKFYDSLSIKDNLDKLQEGVMEIPEKDLKWVNEYYNSFIDVEPDYMAGNRAQLKENVLKKYFNFKKITQLFEAISILIANKEEVYYAYQNPIFYINVAYFKRHFNRKLRLLKIEKIYDIKSLNDINEASKFYLYPIHFHPESSTSVLAPSYIDEYHNILNIARNIPFGTYLYVKEHPSAVGFSAFSFYKKVTQIPNVVLIHHDINARQLVKRALGVITITSTMGYEALILNKPVYLFGRVFYENHPNCTKVKHYDDLFKILIEDKVLKEIDSKYFIYAYYKETYPGNVVYKKEVDSGFINKIGNVIIEAFES